MSVQLVCLAPSRNPLARKRPVFPTGRRDRGLGRAWAKQKAGLVRNAGACPARPGETPLLLVDDDPVDVQIFSEACRDAGLVNRLMVAGDGVEALALLRGTGASRGGTSDGPPLIVLDLKMPRMDGFGFLNELRRDPGLAGLAVVVLSGSEAASDIEAAFQRDVAGYLPKSRLEDDAAGAVRMLANHLRAPASNGSGAAGPPVPKPGSRIGTGLRARLLRQQAARRHR